MNNLVASSDPYDFRLLVMAKMTNGTLPLESNQCDEIGFDMLTNENTYMTDMLRVDLTSNVNLVDS